MLIIGCDYHPGFQQIAFVDTDIGECGERRQAHREEAERFYREVKEKNLSAHRSRSIRDSCFPERTPSTQPKPSGELQDAWRIG